MHLKLLVSGTFAGFKAKGYIRASWVCRELGLADAQILLKLIEKYQLSREAAKDFVSQ